MKYSILTGLLLTLLPSLAGKAQITTDSLLIDNHYRSFYYNATQPLAANASLVFILHGSGGNGKDMMRAAVKLAAVAQKENLLLVYPNGYLNYWNECRKEASSKANLENIDENKFFEGMIDYFHNKKAIDTQKVFAVGTSGGGHMCYKLAMTMPDKIKAITAIIANLPEESNMDCSEAKVALPVMIINGTADPLNPYNGGLMVSGNFKMGHVRSTDQSFKYWATLAGYTGEPNKEKLKDTDPTDGKTIERYTYSKKGKPEITLLKVIWGKHDYPNDIDVHVEAWNFFKRQTTVTNPK